MSPALARPALALAALAVVLGGCGAGDREPQAPGEAVASVLRRGLGAEPPTLDPHLAADNAALAVVADLYEGLTTESRDGSIVAGSAESWSTDERGLVYTFRLRDGLRWSNGDALTAEHFAAGLRHAMDPATAAPNAALLEAIERIDMLAPDSLRIRLRRPLPYLPALLALPVAAPLHPASAVQEPRPGNGAYRIAHREPGNRIELERNPHYWAAQDVAIDRVTHSVVTDLATELNLYRTGELDLTSEVPNASLSWLRESLPGELTVAPYLSVYAYAVNLARIRDVRVRRALAMAIDRERITQMVTGAGERPAHGWVPDGIAHYVPARFDWSQLDYSHTVEEARRLWDLARRDGATPASIELCTDASANHRRTAIAVADLWRSALDIETELVELEWNVYLETRHNPGDCDVIRLGWSADFVDPEAFAMVFETGHPQNTLGYSSAAYDELLAGSRSAAAADRRLAMLAMAEAQLLADAPVIPIFFRVSKRMVKPYVGGVAANPLGHLATRNLSLEPHR